MNRGFEAKRAAQNFESRFFGATAQDGQIGGRKLESQGRERMEQEVESFFLGESSDGEQVRSGAEPSGGVGVAEGMDSVCIDRIGKDLHLGWLDSRVLGEVSGHGFGLTHDFVG